MNPPHQTPPPAPRRPHSPRSPQPAHPRGRESATDSTTRPPASRRRSPRTRAGSSTPATVWACGSSPIAADTPWPTPILEKIVTSFTTRHAEVVLLDLQTAAQTGDRMEGPRSGLGDAAAARDALDDLDRTTRVVHTVEVNTGTAANGWADPPAALPDGEVIRHAPLVDDRLGGEERRADLVIASLAPEDGTTRRCDHLARSAARLLRTGGILAVLTHTDTTGGRLVDPSGPVVSAAQNADLLYLQHIVALLTPIQDGRLRIDADDRRTSSAQTPVHLVPHHRVHADVLIFAQPHEHPSPTPPHDGYGAGALR